MCRYQDGLVLDSRMSESTDVAREAEGEKVVRQPLKWNLRHSETEAGAGYGLFRPSTFDFSTFLKNEATDLYENKGSAVARIGNEATGPVVGFQFSVLSCRRTKWPCGRGLKRPARRRSETVCFNLRPSTFDFF